MDRSAFYTAIRPIFGGKLTQQQVDGLEVLLAECEARGADLYQTAYICATAFGETGGAMQPVRENMNYSPKRIPEVFSASRRQGVPTYQLAHNPRLLANTVYGGDWGRKHLGNTEPNDGWNFRGGLIGQTTGRANYKMTGDKLGVDLIGNPALIDDPKIAARAIVRGMLEGWHGNKHPLSAYVNENEAPDYIGARAIWNGNFEATKYAGYAQKFEAALKAGGYSPKKAPAEQNGIAATIVAFIKAIAAALGGNV